MAPSLKLTTHDPVLDRAFRIATGDFAGNITPFTGEDGRRAPCILAGLDYDKPWTRDAALNSWYAGTVLVPEVARNTLMAVLTRDGGGLRIGGEYWDAIVWSTAAWWHYLWTGDRDFSDRKSLFGWCGHPPDCATLNARCHGGDTARTGV